MLTALPVSRRFTCLLALAGVGAVSVRGLDFNFSNSLTDPAPAEYLTAAVAAGNLWSSYFNDPITINIELRYHQSVVNPPVAGSSALPSSFSYQDVRSAMINDAISADDLSVVANLQSASSTRFLINRTGVVEPSLRMDLGNAGDTRDLNNTSVLVYNATAKALGLRGAHDPAIDAAITLYEGINYDLDRSDGIGGNGVSQYDGIGVIAHEIGHALGMFSTVQIISVSGAFVTEASNGLQPTVADLLRFSADSINPSGPFGGVGANTGVFDISADERLKYFSVDGGLTPITEFAQGSDQGAFGDGQQANHWKDFVLPTPAGLMDPTVAPGELLNFSTVDFRFFDAIGFDPVPEAGTWAAGVAASLALWARRRMNRRA